MIDDIDKNFHKDHGRYPTERERKIIRTIMVPMTMIGYAIIALGITCAAYVIAFDHVDFWIMFWTSFGFVALFYWVVAPIGEKKNGKGN